MVHFIHTFKRSGMTRVLTHSVITKHELYQETCTTSQPIGWYDTEAVTQTTRPSISDQL